MKRFYMLFVPVAVVLLLGGCDLIGNFIEPDGNPTNLSVFHVSFSGVEIRWLDNSTNEVGFSVERKGPEDGAQFVEATRIGAGTTGYIDSGLDTQTKYSYRVRAYNNAGFSEYSSEISVTTLASTMTELEPRLTITSPADGATVRAPFDVEFTITDWGHEDGLASNPATHYHPFIGDGETAQNLGAVYDLVSPYTASGLDPGVYVVTLKLANSDHTFIGVEDTIEVTVE